MGHNVRSPFLSTVPAFGGTPYHASAVHFDGTVCLYARSLSVAQTNGDYTMAFFFKDVTPAGSGFVSVRSIEQGTTVTAFWSTPSPTPSNGIYFDFVDQNDLHHLNADTDNTSLSGGWHSFLASCRTNFPAGSKIVHIYLDDVDVTANVADAAVAFTMLFNGLPISIFGDGFTSDYLLGDFANMWIAPGVYIDFTVMANRRKFITAANKPVNLGSDGSTPTGTAPAIYFTGNASSFGSNAGPGGSFLQVTAFNPDSGKGSNGPGPVTVTGLKIGDVVGVVSDTSSLVNHDVTSDFETTISVNNQIQQTGAVDLSADFLVIEIVRSVLTNASTSPSD